eukprot:TRINITY_DN9504_c0_g1_i1.p1 TRINITY_DN9504_c0_g1~~TRINITY_DN9504_c0_g1_i1.p1  ORF type:complete len:414 (-),score=124.02 TRINITY_DN9504_c0_g1_i1:17-1258(-)
MKILLEYLCEVDGEKKEYYDVKSFFERCFEVKDPKALKASLIRFSYYKGDEHEAQKELLYSHLDAGFLTLIPCSPVPGLQVLDNQSYEWVNVEEGGSFNKMHVLVGGALGHMTGNIFRGTYHSVVNQHPGKKRLSMVFLLRPNHDALILSKFGDLRAQDYYEKLTYSNNKANKQTRDRLPTALKLTSHLKHLQNITSISLEGEDALGTAKADSPMKLAIYWQGHPSLPQLEPLLRSLCGDTHHTPTSTTLSLDHTPIHLQHHNLPLLQSSITHTLSQDPNWLSPQLLFNIQQSDILHDNGALRGLKDYMKEHSRGYFRFLGGVHRPSVALCLPPSGLALVEGLLDRSRGLLSYVCCLNGLFPPQSLVELLYVVENLCRDEVDVKELEGLFKKDGGELQEDWVKIVTKVISSSK